MRPKHDTPDLHSQVETLTSELELSTFLNKGILQSNSEYKLRITELERENAVLRAAERRLTATEDALESADKRCRDLIKEVARLEREVEGERTGKDRCLRETASFGRRWDELRVVWQGFREGMDECLQEETKETRAEGSSRGRKAPRKSQAGAATTRRAANTRAKSVEVEEAEPVSPVVNGARKRRRAQAIVTDDEEDEESASPPPSRKKSAAKFPTQSAQTPKEKDKKAAPNPTSTKKRKAASQRKSSASQEDEVMILKAEPISPADRLGRRQQPPQQLQQDDSDEDPLAMD